MTQQQHESRWSLNHRGNRIALAVVIGLVVGACGNVAADLGTAAHILVIALVAVVTYWLLTALRR